MPRVLLLKEDDLKLEFLDTGEGNEYYIQDFIGKNYGEPYSVGIAEVHPSKNIEFEYDVDGAVCIGLEGVVKVTDTLTNEEFRFGPGEILYIPREQGKVIRWDADERARFAYVAYPHWK